MLDAVSGEMRQHFHTSADYVTTAPAVIDGVVYVGLYYGDVLALGNITPQMMRSHPFPGTPEP
jgi:hypothetical protein